jgi:hypothetical protein
MKDELPLLILPVALLLLFLIMWRRTMRLLGPRSIANLRREFRLSIASSNISLLVLCVAGLVTAPGFLVFDFAPPLVNHMSVIFDIAFLLYLATPPTLVLLGPSTTETSKVRRLLRSNPFNRVLVALPRLREIQDIDNAISRTGNWLDYIDGRIASTCLVVVDVRFANHSVLCELSRLAISGQIHKAIVFGTPSSPACAALLSLLPALPRLTSQENLLRMVDVLTRSRVALEQFYTKSRVAIRSALIIRAQDQREFDAYLGTASVNTIRLALIAHYGTETYRNDAYGFTVSYGLAWVAIHLDRKTELNGTQLSIRLIDGSASLGISAGPPDDAEATDRDRRVLRLYTAVKSEQAIENTLVERQGARLGGETNVVWLTYRVEKEGHNEHTAAIISCVRGGIEVRVRWHSAANNEEAIESVISSFAFERVTAPSL